MGSVLSSLLRDPFVAAGSKIPPESVVLNDWDIDYLSVTQRYASAHVSDARLLLADMASTHKFAADAGWVVRSRIDIDKEKSQS